MRTSLKEYLPTVLWGAIYSVAVGGVGGLVGWAFNLGLVKDMPALGWVLVFAAAFTAAQFRTFHKVRQERDRLRTRVQESEQSLEPDLYIADALDHIAQQSAWGEGRDILEVFQELRQAGAAGRVTVWGRLYTGGKRFDEDKPLIPIIPGYWADHGFEETHVLAAREEVRWTNMTRDEYGGGRQELYGDLHFNEAQVRRRWAPK